jgi:hypothetical protein
LCYGEAEGLELALLFVPNLNNAQPDKIPAPNVISIPKNSKSRSGGELRKPAIAAATKARPPTKKELSGFLRIGDVQSDIVQSSLSFFFSNRWQSIEEKRQTIKMNISGRRSQRLASPR